MVKLDVYNVNWIIRDSSGAVNRTGASKVAVVDRADVDTIMDSCAMTVDAEVCEMQGLAGPIGQICVLGTPTP